MQLGQGRQAHAHVTASAPVASCGLVWAAPHLLPSWVLVFLRLCALTHQRPSLQPLSCLQQQGRRKNPGSSRLYCCTEPECIGQACLLYTDSVRSVEVKLEAAQAGPGLARCAGAVQQCVSSSRCSSGKLKRSSSLTSHEKQTHRRPGCLHTAQARADQEAVQQHPAQ